MATVTQTIEMPSTYSPLVRPPHRAAIATAIPRGTRTFFVDGAVLDAKLAVDTQVLVMRVSLEQNFAYFLQSVELAIFSAEAAAWSTTGSLIMQRAMRNLPATSAWHTPTAILNVAVTSARYLTRQGLELPPFPLVPVRGTGFGGAVNFILAHENASAGASAGGSINCHMTLLEYDLEQVENFPLSFGMPVSQR